MNASENPNTNIEERLAYFDIGEADVAALQDLKARLAPLLPNILDRFYDHIVRDGEAAKVIYSASVRMRAQEAQRRHWEERVLSGTFDETYALAAARIGQTHFRVGVDLRRFIGGYCFIMREFSQAVLDLYAHAPDRQREMLHTIEKAVFLDMDIAASLYAERSTSAMKTLSLTDPLTGAPNRRGILEAGLRAYGEAMRHERPLCVALLDLDRFKQVNDTHGHAAGDAVLRQMAACIKGTLRASDAFGRWGGEEFLILMPDTPYDQALSPLQRLLDDLKRFLFRMETGTFHVTASIGLATSRRCDRSIENTIARADTALYAAKHAGRNRVKIAA